MKASREILFVGGTVLLMVGMGVMTYATLHWFMQERPDTGLWWTVGILSMALSGNALFWRNV